MSPKRPLRVVDERAEGLGVETIMRAELAARHGVRYVHLAVFAIDVDRVLEAAPDDDPRPFAWEVFLTETYLLGSFDAQVQRDRDLVEEVCLDILDADPEIALLGGQLPFAVYDAIQRGVWPESLREIFRPWKGRGDKLTARLAPLWGDPSVHAAKLARSCLNAPLAPPLAAPSRLALEALAGAGPAP